MPRIAIADSFLDSLAELDPSDAKRVALFLDKLVREPEASSLRPEIVHDAADRSVRSFRVTRDLRAITRVAGDDVTLLFVARHDRAYEWARNRCIECHGDAGELVLRPADQIEAGPMPSMRALRVAVCSTTGDLCRLLSARGIQHGLTDGLSAQGA
jgi:hypothetical protein